MVEEGRNINALDYVDTENNLVELISAFTDQWYDLGTEFDEWYEEVTETYDNFHQFKKHVSTFTSTLAHVAQDSPLPVKLDPSRLRSQVEEVEVTIITCIYALLCNEVA